ncbi:NAD dependent epimerase/dehydratase superfamily protein [Pelomyxa schiedti]|nr:NAD dependent epimerase/dehydratase superfamily protein [Pelomyxa schiedti]
MSSKVVLVSGANGYTGRAVCLAFRRAGFRVMGIVRTEQKAQAARLVHEEIIPIIVDDLTNTDLYAHCFAEAGIVIECASMTESPAIMQAMLNRTAASGNDELGRPKLFIFTTGFRQYPLENIVLSHPGVTGCVVRPGFIYGGSGGIVGENLYFKRPDALEIQGNRLRKWTWVHIDDLAEAYVLIDSHRAIAQGQTFGVAAKTGNPTYEELLIAGAKATGYTGPITYSDVTTGFQSFVAFEVTDFSPLEKTERLLGWTPKHTRGLLADIDIYYASYRAWHS